MQTFANRFRTVSLRDTIFEFWPENTKPVIWVFEGRAGSGKTTAFWLSAAAMSLAKPDPLALISTDSFHIGASRSFVVTGRIIDRPVRPVRSAVTLFEALAKNRARHCLIDMATQSSERHNSYRVLRAFDKDYDVFRIRVISVHELLASGLPEPKNEYAAFVVTKLDEIVEVQRIEDILSQSNIRLLFMTNSPDYGSDVLMPKTLQT